MTKAKLISIARLRSAEEDCKRDCAGCSKEKMHNKDCILFGKHCTGCVGFAKGCLSPEEAKKEPKIKKLLTITVEESDDNYFYDVEAEKGVTTDKVIEILKDFGIV